MDDNMYKTLYNQMMFLTNAYLRLNEYVKELEERVNVTPSCGRKKRNVRSIDDKPKPKDVVSGKKNPGCACKTIFMGIPTFEQE